MPKLVITDIDSDGSESATVYNVASYAEATEALLEDLGRTASADFTNVAMHYWAAKGNVDGFSFILSNTTGEVVLTDSGNRAKFEYLP